MSKNLTRKGLAFGALVALTSSVIAGSPAFAAGELTVVPSAGTSYNTFSSAVFNLKTTFAPGFAPASYSQLKYLVKTDANSAIKYQTGLAAVDSAAINAATVDSVAVSTTSSAISAGATAATDVAYIGFEASTTTVSSSVEVTAFVDANNDGALTSGEWNTVRTVNFKKAADIVPAVTLTAPATGDTSLKATVAWGDLNIEQIADETVKFTAGTQLSTADAGTLASGVWSKTVSTALAASEAVTAQAYIGTTALGSAASAVASARTISDSQGLVSNVLKSNDALATAATGMVTNTAATVRTNGSFTAQVKAFDRATTPAAKSGVAVSASAATSATLRPASTGVTEISVTFNGTKYTTNATLNAAVAALTTDASGLASVAVSSFGLVDGQTVTVTFAAQNLSSAVVATQRDAVYTVTDDAASTIVATNKNAAASFNYSIKDQFGVLSARTNERLVVSTTVASGTAPATQYIAVSGGKAAFSVTPTTDNTADVTVAAALEVSTNTNGSISWAANGTDVANRVIKVRAAAYSFSVAPAVAEYNNVTATAGASQPLTASALADLAAPTDSDAIWAKVTLTGTNAGEKLTATAAGTFLSIDGAVVTANSATKVAQGTVVEIFVASNTTGTKTLTISNGSVTSTVSVVFAKAVETAGSVVELTAPANAGPGTSFVVSGVVKDKFGNVVDTTTGSTSTLSVTYDGPGIVVPASGSITETNASGAFSFRVILGANETGTGVVTATYDADGAGTTAAVVATKTINAAVVASAAAAGSTGKVFASATNAAGKWVVVKVNGKFAKSFAGTAAKKAVSIVAAKGTKTITVYVGGKLTLTKVVIVK